MRIIQTFLIAVLLGIFTSVGTAQDAEKPYLETLIEDALSSPNLNVSLSGMQGTFSSSARVDKIDISDKDGIWLSIEDAELDWTRSALLRKRVEISNLSASTINLFRIPASDAETTPEAGSFRVPELPVALNIETIFTKELIIGAPVFGMETKLKIDGNVAISDALFDINLSMQDLDKNGVFDFQASVDTLTNVADIELDATEGANGVLVNLLDIPNKPAMTIRVDGQGPQDAFETNFEIETDGSPRLQGRALVETYQPNETPDGLQISLSALGDLSPLFKETYRPFFNDQSRLNATAFWRDNGEILVPTLELDTAALSLDGNVELAADNTPTLIQLNAVISDQNDAPILLPISGAETFVTSATLSLDYDPDVPWFADVTLNGFQREGVEIEALQLYGFGEIPEPFVVKNASDLLFSANIEASSSSISFDDPNLNEMLGDTVRLTASAKVTKDEPLEISDLTFDDGNLSAMFSGQILGLETAFNTVGQISASVGDISVLSGLTGQNLQGSATIQGQGNFEMLTGAFALDATTNVAKISTGSPSLDPILAGSALAKLSATRTETGIFLESVEFSNAQVNAQANGLIQSEKSSINLSSVINNLGILSDGLTGSLRSSGTLTQTGNDIDVDLQSSGIAGLRADVAGTIPIDGSGWNIALNGQAPLAFSDPYLTSSGARARGNVDFDLALRGAPSVRNLSGTIVSDGARLVLPNQDISLTNINTRATLSDGVANTELTANLAKGGQISLDGALSFDDAFRINSDLNINLADVIQRDQNFYTTKINGDLTLSGNLTGQPNLAGAVSLSDTEVSLQSTFSPTVSFLPDIVHKNDTAAVRRTRTKAGVTQTPQTSGSSTSIGLDVLVSAPSRVFIRGRGLDAELGGTLRLRGTTQSVAPIGSFNLIRGRLDILGKRLNLTEGSISMAGALDPRLRIVAARSSDDYDMSIIISGLVSDPKFTFTSVPSLPEDEILVRLFFDRNLDEISPFQALQLAAALRELTGAGGTSFLQRVRGKLGVDDFSIETTDEGDTQVSAGKYISENVYTDINVGSSGETEITINLDVNENVTATGSVSDSGESKIGIFFKKDY